MADWTNIKMIDGWATQQTANGIELSAQLWASTREAFPVRGDAMPARGSCTPPARYLSYRLRDISVTKLSGAGPYLAQVTFGHNVGVTTAGRGDRILDQTSLQAGYMDFHVLPEWCALRPAPSSVTPKRIEGAWDTGKWASAVNGDAAGNWDNWTTAYNAGIDISGSLFRNFLNPHFADTTQRFLQVTVTFHVKETSAGLEKWGGFSGVVPVSSMPSWIAIPTGISRWRLFDEEIERVIENDGKTRLFKVMRVLLGVPGHVTDSTGARARWSTAALGEREWDDL